MWQVLSNLVTYVTVSAKNALIGTFNNIIDEFKKFAILKKGIGIESQNLCKQFNDQKTIQTRWNSTVAIYTDGGN